jgi:DNA-binding HxlR family transcriptional regulator
MSTTAALDTQPGTGEDGPRVGADAVCTALDVINRVSGKWSIGILLLVMDGPVRFTELERNLKGVSRRMLTLTLKNLERDGLVTRTVHATAPPKVEYSATDVARELYDSLTGLFHWANRNQHIIAADRADRDSTED